VAKLGVVLEEVDESVLWIEMLIDAEIMKKSRLDPLLNESRQLTAIFTASRQTAKQK
jgi:four helix bundle protein